MCKEMISRNIMLFVMIAVLSIVWFPQTAVAVGSIKGNRNNIVFVTDESGSMKRTDPQKQRYEAIKLFLGEMPNDGNRIGSVSFGEGIVDYIDIAPIKGQNERQSFIDAVSDQQFSNYTNIGMGLSKAVDLLDEGKDPELDSTIILLTDGNTDMPDADQLQASQELKADAIERARKAGYRIFTICLNVNGAADSAEMKQIADATGGQFAEIQAADDLKHVETLFNKLIFGAVEHDDGGREMTIGSDGSISADFDVVGVGVEEFNVLIEGAVDRCVLRSPSGKEYSGPADDCLYTNGEDFLVTKVIKPEGGEWTSTVYGNPNAVINFRLLYNMDFYVITSISKGKDYAIGDSVTVTAKICNREGVVGDTSQYTGLTCEATVRYGDQEEKIPMSLSSDGFMYTLDIDKEGTWFISVTAISKEMSAEADEVYEINVNNSAPVPTGIVLKAHANIWPVIGGRATVSIEEGATDPEGQPLFFSIDSTAFQDKDYELDNNSITVKRFSIPKGTFTVRATDPFGAYCTFDVIFTSTNVGIIMTIAILAGALLILIIIVMKLYNDHGKSLMGTLSVSLYDDANTYSGPPSVLTHGRGRILLRNFALDTTMFEKNCYFQCDGRNKKVYFVSKKAVYSDAAARPQKKITITGEGREVLICVDEEMKRGICAKFESDLVTIAGF